MIYGTTFAKSVTVSTLSSRLNLNLVAGLPVFRSLVSCLELEVSPQKCVNCAHRLEGLPRHCPECLSGLIDDYSFDLVGVLSPGLQTKFTRLEYQEGKAIGFARAWAQRSIAHYLLVDLVQSETTQKRNEGEFNRFLAEIRRTLKNLLSQSIDPVVSLGEIGDCHKLVFLGLNDAFNVLQKFSVFLDETQWRNRYRDLFEKSPPQFRATLHQVELESDFRNQPDGLFAITMNGGLDFTSSAVTKMFRFEGKLDFEDKAYLNTNIAVWIQQDQLILVGFDGVPLRVVSYSKNGIEASAHFGLLQFEAGQCFYPEDLVGYYKGSETETSVTV